MRIPAAASSAARRAKTGSWVAGSRDGDSIRAQIAQEGRHLLLAGEEMGEEGARKVVHGAAAAPSVVSIPRQVSSLSSKIGRLGARPRAALMCQPQRSAHLR